jgi:hypothetical protein
MDELLDAAAELLSVAVYAVGAVLAALVGVAAEWAGYQQLSAGTGSVVALWFGLIGAIALYASLNLLGEFRARVA